MIGARAREARRPARPGRPVLTRPRPVLSRLGPGVLGVFLALGSLVTLGAPPVVRAEHQGGPDLTLVTDARYEVLPDAKRVHVSISITATNHLTDTATRSYYYDRAFLAVLPGSSGFRISGEQGTPKVVVSSRKADHTLLRIDFGARLASGKSTTFALGFDLIDPGGAGNRDLRVGTTVVSFPIWAFGTDSTPGSRVQVALPVAYHVEFLAGNLPGPEVGPDGLAVYDSGALQEPLAFYAYLVGDRPGTYVDTTLSVPIADTAATIVIQAWQDDPEWAVRVGDLFARGLPVLGRSIGLPWPAPDALFVREALARNTGGYAGIFDPAEGRIDVAYYAGPGVVLHEAAHRWFNGGLLADRWSNEAFASLYGQDAAAELGIDVADPELTEALDASRIPLNDWAPIGEADDAVETYAYAASLALAREIAERAGDGPLREVWAKAQAKVGAYQPIGGDAQAGTAEGNETVDSPPDWRGLLDLLEESTGQSFTDLWTTWVVRDSDLPLLEQRANAQGRYNALVAAADDWRLPSSIRTALRAWQFDTADRLFDDAAEVLNLRSEIARQAARHGLNQPSTLRPLFEAGDGFAAANAEATAQLGVLAALDRVVAVRIAEPGIVEQLGLIGTRPERDLDAARRAYEVGELETAGQRAGDAWLAWTTAAEVGGGRAMSLLLLGLAVAIVLIVVVRWSRGRSRRAAASVENLGRAGGPE